MSNNQQQNGSFRRQTLGNISPGQLNNRGANAATRISNKEITASNGAAPAGNINNGKARKSMMPAGTGPGNLGAGASENRSSAMGLDRRSSAYTGKPAGPKQDPRPVGDKNFQGNCIRAIITYLSTHQYPAAVSPKTLTSPTAKEFTLIVQFLMQRFDPNMKTFGKIEDDVPLFFKRLNYPFQISKSGLFAVGSPHSWPAVLAALTWLVELLNYNAKVEEGSSGNGRSSGGSSFDIEGKAKAEFFDYTCTSYRHFLAGDDARCEAVDDQFVSQFRAKEDEFAESYSKLQKSHADLLAQLERLRSEPSPLIAAHQRRQDQLADADKLAALISNLQTFKQQTQRKISERQTDIKSKQDQMTEAQQENDRLRQRISVQPVNKAELHKMNLDRAKQRQVLEAVSGQCEDMERKAHAQELQIVNDLKGLEAAVDSYNSAAHRLKLIPASAKRADGTTFQMRLHRDAATPAELTNLDLKGVVRPGLERLCESYRTKASQLGQDLVSLREQCGARAEAVNERKEDMAGLEAQIAALEAQLASSKEGHEARLRGLAERALRIKAEAGQLHNAASSRQASVEERRRTAMLDYDQAQRNCDALLSKTSSDLRTALSMMVSHRASMHARVQATMSVMQQAHTDVVQLQQGSALQR